MTPDQARGLSSVFLSSGSISQIRRPAARYIEMSWSGAQSRADYFREKVEEVRRFFPTKAQARHHLTRTRRGLPAPGLRFKITSDQLMPLFNLFVPRGTKRISSSVLELCGARAAAWVFSDRAVRTPAGIELRSLVHSTEEAVLVGQWLQTLLGISCRFRLRRLRPTLLIAPDEAAKAAEILLDYSPTTSRPLFLAILNDRDPVCDSRSLLLPGGGRIDVPAGQALQALAAVAPL